jgi:phosphatidylethanolamine/phosphatidyl-N-methylethanolamine N-methyltransferase
MLRGMHTLEEEREDPVATFYRQLAPAYDLIYGVILHPGRRAAIARMALAPGTRVLEVGAGTGLSAVMYPPGCDVLAVDFSREMLMRAEARLARRGITNVRLMEADATRLRLESSQFDIVYAPYLINVVSDPLSVAREMRRVCRPDGRVVFLNHFRGDNAASGWVDDTLDRLVMAKAGVRWNLAMTPLLKAASLEPLSVTKVNVPRFSTLAVCRPGRATD